MKNNPGGINSRLDRAEVEVWIGQKSMQHGTQEKRHHGGKERGENYGTILSGFTYV